MSTKVSDHVLQRLREWGVDHVFGYPGDGINGLLAAWGRGPRTSLVSSCARTSTGPAVRGRGRCC